MKIEVVVHCFDQPEVPIYSKLLHYHLSGFALHPPKDCEVNVVVCCSAEDEATIGRINEYKKHEHPVRIYDCLMPLGILFRRAIGRDIVALDTEADLVVFTDCDYVWRGEAFDALANLYRAGQRTVGTWVNMVHPRIVNIHNRHSAGDMYIAVARAMTIPGEINLDDFIPRKEKRAWGGIQIMSGSYCRKHGYGCDPRWLKPVDPEKGFQSCRGDVSARRNAGGSTAIDIPGVYRLRHTHAGRDKGKVDHGKKTRGG